MLSIARLRVGQEAYQLSGVAESLDAYYTGAGEIPGVWVGGGAAGLGLDGEVTADDLRAVLAGLAPNAGGLSPNGGEANTHPRRAPGFDFTFKVPKSASVLYAVTDDPRVQGAIIEAGERAMRETLGWIEREAVRVRRGTHNKAWLAAHPDELEKGPHRLETTGVAAASFRHRTSRAGDPLLHWHVLVANMAEGTDGRWSALTHPELYRHMHAAGQIFQATYRTELSKALGVEWRPGRYVHEIAGVPQTILDLFSKRTAEVDAWLAATGTPNTPVGRQEAVLATRRSKHEQEHLRFDSVWKEEAEAAGWGPDRAEALVAFAGNRTRTTDTAWRLTTAVIGEDSGVEHVDRLVDPEEWIGDLLRRDLTVDRTTFSAADIHQAVAGRLGDGASVATIERITNRVLASPQTIAVASDPTEPDRWTSSEILAIEARFVTAVDHTLPQLTALAVQPASGTTHSDLGADQRAAVHTLLASTSAVSVLIGPAGTGKTYTLDAVRAGLEHAGLRVIGATPSARAALELEAGAGIPTSTLHALLRRWDQHLDSPDARTVLVIDEAGMADIRTLEAALTRHTNAGGRVLLVGDHHQLPEVGAGGGFAYAASHAHTIAELSINRRQQEPWEQDALANLRDGSVPDAVAAYLAHDRVLVTPDPRSMIDTATDAWFTARAAGQHPVLLAGTTDLVDRLNSAVIDRLIRDGELPEAVAGRYGADSYRIGERVVLRRNSTLDHDGHTLTLANGQAGTVTALADRTLTVQLDTGHQVTLDHRYLANGGHLSHAYALTTHRAQGGTWDTAIAVGADGLYREGAYVELSRGRHTNLLVLTDPETAELARTATTEVERHDSALVPPHERAGELDDELVERMSRSRAKDLAHTLDPDLAAVDQLATTHSWHQLHTLRDYALAAEHTARSTAEEPREQLVARRDRLEHIAHHIGIGQKVSPHDRHNIGTVIAVDDRNGEATLHFVSRGGSEATHRFRWEDLRIVEPHTPPAHPLTPAARRHLKAVVADIDARIARIDQHLADAGIQAGDANRYTRAIDRQTARASHTLRADQPEWLTALIGQRPADVAGARTWDDAVTAIATWRLDHDLQPHTPGLGATPASPADADAWHELHTRLGLTRTWLDTSDRRHETWHTVPSHRELHARLVQLDEILAGAPPDCRDTIHRLQTGQLTFDDTTELLQAAATTAAATTVATTAVATTLAPANAATQPGAEAVAAAEAAAKTKPLKAAGDPIVIGFQNPEGDPAGSFPEYTLGAEAAVKYINEELGGVGADHTAGKPGRPIQLEVCRMAITPAASQQCANELAGKKPFAVISSLNFFGNHFAIYKAANIPVVVGTPITALDFTSPGAFAIGNGGGCLGTHTGMIDFVTKDLGRKRIAVPWANTPPGVFCYHDLEKKPLEVLAGKKLDGSDIKAEGNEAKGRVPDLTHIGVAVRPGLSDMTPQATQVLDFSPDGIMYSAQAVDCWTFVNALVELGWKASETPLVLSAACLDFAKMQAMGAAAKGIYFVGSGSFADPNSLTGQSAAEAATYQAKMAQYAEGGSDTAAKGFAVSGFSAVMRTWEIATEQAAGDPASLDPTKFAAAFGATRNHHSYMGPGLSCADGAGNAPYVAVCDSLVAAWQWDGTRLNVARASFSGLYLLKGTTLDFGT